MITDVYTPVVGEGFELCHPRRSDGFEEFHVLINGAPRRRTWNPIPVDLIHDDGCGKALIESDSPWLGVNALVFRQSAIDALDGMLERYGELLPLDCAEARLWVFNPKLVIDALDEHASEVIRFRSGSLMWIERHEFKRDKLNGIEIFKIPNIRISATFLGESFVQQWHEAGLRGLDFEKVWSASKGGIRRNSFRR